MGISHSCVLVLPTTVSCNSKKKVDIFHNVEVCIYIYLYFILYTSIRHCPYRVTEHRIISYRNSTSYCSHFGQNKCEIVVSILQTFLKSDFFLSPIVQLISLIHVSVSSFGRSTAKKCSRGHMEGFHID